jgi:hypothetical protein
MREQSVEPQVAETILSPKTLSIAPSSLIVCAQSELALPVLSIVPDTISYFHHASYRSEAVWSYLLHFSTEPGGYMIRNFMRGIS